MDARHATDAHAAAAGHEGAGPARSACASQGATTEFDALACRILARAGFPLSTDALPRMRMRLRQAAQAPAQAVQAAMRRHAIVALGEMHTWRGRALLPELVEAAACAGARTLFLEVRRDEQDRLDAFASTGRISDLPASVGGAGEPPLPSDLPYQQMLIRARQRGLRLVAMDDATVDESVRDARMAEVVQRTMQDAPDRRAVMVVGQLHLMRRAQPFTERPLAALLDAAPRLGTLWTLGRAVPDAVPELGVWALAAVPAAPAVVARGDDRLLDQLPGHGGPQPLRGDDFDAVLLVPASEDERNAWRLASQTVTVTAPR
jgi:hypothetical protein